ncbi:MAG: hypothetical protein HY070_03800 [Chloroflexi bacterium]|nr:hypothetical protein [Chloroflexota bacterium]
MIGFDFITQFQANPQIASAPAAEKFVAPQSVPQATNALPRVAQPQIVSTPTPLSADAAQKISPQPATGLAAQSPAPTARVEARAEPTRAPSESQTDLARQQTPLVRSAEIILVLIVFGLGVVAFRSR